MYTYKSLVEDLSMGREVEFEYNNLSYSISTVREGLVFTNVTNQTYKKYKNYEHLLKDVEIEKKKLKEIFNNDLYKNLSIF